MDGTAVPDARSAPRQTTIVLRSAQDDSPDDSDGSSSGGGAPSSGCPVPLRDAAAQCETLRLLEEDAEDEEAPAEIALPVPADAVAAIAAFIRKGGAAPVFPDPTSTGATGLDSHQIRYVEEEILQGQGMEGRSQLLLDVMIGADFLRNEQLLQLCAAYAAHRISSSAPNEIRAWGGQTPGAALSPEEREAATALQAALQQRFA